MQYPRQFKCSINSCNQYTAFDLKTINVPSNNFVICEHCQRKWYATIMPSCCKIDILFVLEVPQGNKPRTSLQSFMKG
jgi:hypothetical protein